jgi:hypothetical protein
VRDAGLTCISRARRSRPCSTSPKPADAQIQEAFSALAARIGSHPAAFGVYLRDEPSASRCHDRPLARL